MSDRFFATARSIVTLFCLCATILSYATSVCSAGITGPGSTIPVNGANTYLLGANYAWWNYGTDFGTGAWGKYTNWSQIGTDFATMHNQGVKTVRWWVFADGRYAPDFNSDGTIAGLDSSVFSDVDQALSIAAQNNTYLILTLVDFKMWQAPVSSGGVTGGGHSALITDAHTQQTYLDNALKPLLQHIAASPNKNFVLAYDIVNEPEWTIKETWNSSLPLAQVQTFVQKCATYIHQYGGNAYATLGSGTPYWTANWKGLGLDFYETHYYPNYDSNGPGSGLPTYASLNLDRPCIIGEFATADKSYTIGDTTVQSAQWYLDTIYKYGYAGALAWGYESMDSECNWASFQPVFTNWANTHTAAPVASISGLYNTGVDNNGNPIADSSTDPHYSLVSTPSGAAGIPYVTQQQWPIQNGAWMLDSSTSKWISPHPNESQYLDAAGNYTYQTTFTVTGDPAHVTINGQCLGDDQVTAIVLNGTTVATNIANGFSSWSAFSIGSSFKAGTNTLQLIVHNGGTSPNPSGFRCELKAATK